MKNINIVATQNANFKGAKPNDNFYNFTSLINSLDESYINDNMQLLTQLYKKFTPPTPANLKAPIDILKKAVAKNDARYYLNYIYIDDKNIVATDGHRLSMYSNDDNLAPGFYNKNMNKCDIGATYPDYKRVIPTTNREIEINLKECEVFIFKGQEVIRLNFHDGKFTTVNLKYLKDVIGKHNTFTVKYNYGLANDEFIRVSTLITNPDFPNMTNILMPVRTDIS